MYPSYLCNWCDVFYLRGCKLLSKAVSELLSGLPCFNEKVLSAAISVIWYFNETMIFQFFVSVYYWCISNNKPIKAKTNSFRLFSDVLLVLNSVLVYYIMLCLASVIDFTHANLFINFTKGIYILLNVKSLSLLSESIVLMFWI